MKNYFTSQKVFSLLIVAGLIVNVSISGISNSSQISFLIKLLSSAILVTIFIIHLRLSNISLTTLFSLKALKRMLLIIAAVILYLGIALIYSSNPYYGAQKIINIIVSVVPNVFVLFYIVTYIQKDHYGKYLLYVIAAGFILTLISILIFQPFDQSTSYHYEPGRWSHVFIGRTISFLTLIIFLYLLDEKKSKRIIIYSSIFTIGLYITYLTGLRSALIGLALCALGSVIWNLRKKNLNKFHFYSIILILTFSIALIYITPQGFTTSERISKLVRIEELNFGGDAAISTRIESYKIGWQMFKDRPIIGYGFGSFNGYDKIEWTTLQKYPHNIVLEILSELGIVGFVLFSLLIFYMINRIYNYQFTIISEESEVKGQRLKVKNDYISSTTLSSHFLLPAFFFCLFLAMFSKDISTQGFLWLFLVAFSGKGKEQSE